MKWRAEVVRSDLVEAGGIVAISPGGETLDGHVAARVAAGNRGHARAGGARDAGQRRQTLAEIVIELPRPLFRVAIQLRRQDEREQVIRANPEIHLREVQQRLAEQPRRDEQQERDRRLQRDQSLSEEAGGSARGGLVVLISQRGRQLRPRRLQGGVQPEDEDRRRREQQGERQHAHVERRGEDVAADGARRQRGEDAT